MALKNMLIFDSTSDLPPSNLLAWAQSLGYGNCLFKRVSVRLAVEADGITFTEMVDESGYIEMIPLEISDGSSTQKYYVGKIDWFVTSSQDEKAFFCWAPIEPDPA